MTALTDVSSLYDSLFYSTQQVYEVFSQFNFNLQFGGRGIASREKEADLCIDRRSGITFSALYLIDAVAGKRFAQLFRGTMSLRIVERMNSAQSDLEKNWRFVRRIDGHLSAALGETLCFAYLDNSLRIRWKRKIATNARGPHLYSIFNIQYSGPEFSLEVYAHAVPPSHSM